MLYNLGPPPHLPTHVLPACLYTLPSHTYILHTLPACLPLGYLPPAHYTAVLPARVPHRLRFTPTFCRSTFGLRAPRVSWFSPPAAPPACYLRTGRACAHVLCVCGLPPAPRTWFFFVLYATYRMALRFALSSCVCCHHFPLLRHRRSRTCAHHRHAFHCLPVPLPAMRARTPASACLFARSHTAHARTHTARSCVLRTGQLYHACCFTLPSRTVPCLRTTALHACRRARFPCLPAVRFAAFTTKFVPIPFTTTMGWVHTYTTWVLVLVSFRFHAHTHTPCTRITQHSPCRTTAACTRTLHTTPACLPPACLPSHLLTCRCLYALTTPACLPPPHATFYVPCLLYTTCAFPVLPRACAHCRARVCLRTRTHTLLDLFTWLRLPHPLWRTRTHRTHAFTFACRRHTHATAPPARIRCAAHAKCLPRTRLVGCPGHMLPTCHAHTAPHVLVLHCLTHTHTTAGTVWIHTARLLPTGYTHTFACHLSVYTCLLVPTTPPVHATHC